MSARILIVDDEEIVIKSCLRILGGGDCHVEAAYDGREALRKIEKNLFEVIILDVMMPNMGGLEVLRRVKETNSDVDVIMMTGLSQADTVVQARQFRRLRFYFQAIRAERTEAGGAARAGAAVAVAGMAAFVLCAGLSDSGIPKPSTCTFAAFAVMQPTRSLLGLAWHPRADAQFPAELRRKALLPFLRSLPRWPVAVRSQR